MDLQLGLFEDGTGVGPSPAGRRGADAPVGPAVPPAHVTELAKGLPAGLRLGTSSWSFPGWEGLVYDRAASESTLARHGLEAYARHPLLRTVGLDRTFYRPISEEDFRRYADAVPDDFRFLVKADRALTSPVSTDRSIRGPNPRFLDVGHAIENVVAPAVAGLGPKAGPLLFQFPPIAPNVVGGRAAFLDRLRGFLSALPEGPLYAVEIRTPAFLTDAYSGVLQDTGVAHGYTVHPAMAPLARQLEVVSPFYQPALVVRWMLHAGLRYEAAKDRYQPFDRIVDEDVASRGTIAVAALDALIAERDVFVIANNKAEGSAPMSLLRLAEHITRWADRSPPEAARALVDDRGPGPMPIGADR